MNIFQRNVSLAAFDGADVGAVETREFGQCLLRETSREARPPYSLTELAPDIAALASQI